MRKNEEEVRALEEFEKSESFRVMAMNYEAQMKTLRERHAYEMDVLLAAHRRREEEFMAAVEEAVGCSEKRVGMLQKLIEEVSNPDVVWNRYHRFEGRSSERAVTPVKLHWPFINPRVAGSLCLPSVKETKQVKETGVWRAHTPLRVVF
jgi:hypothetical protein